MHHAGDTYSAVKSIHSLTHLWGFCRQLDKRDKFRSFSLLREVRVGNFETELFRQEFQLIPRFHHFAVNASARRVYMQSSTRIGRGLSSAYAVDKRTALFGILK